MAATTYAMYTQNGGTSVSNAWPQVGGPAQNLDLLQIVDNNGQGILCNVDYLGTVHTPKSAATTANTRIGVFQTGLDSTATTAQLFANAFTNPQQQDILQIVAEGGNVVYYLDYLGVSHGS